MQLSSGQGTKQSPIITRNVMYSDALFSSGYEAYDRLSPAYKRFVEGLTAEHDGNHFLNVRVQYTPGE